MFLRGNAHSATKASVDATIAAMERLDRCGFATMLSLVSTLAERDSMNYCFCGIVAPVCLREFREE